MYKMKGGFLRALLMGNTPLSLLFYDYNALSSNNLLCIYTAEPAIFTHFRIFQPIMTALRKNIKTLILLRWFGAVVKRRKYYGRNTAEICSLPLWLNYCDAIREFFFNFVMAREWKALPWPTHFHHMFHVIIQSVTIITNTLFTLSKNKASMSIEVEAIFTIILKPSPKTKRHR